MIENAGRRQDDYCGIWSKQFADVAVMESAPNTASSPPDKEPSARDDASQPNPDNLN